MMIRKVYGYVPWAKLNHQQAKKLYWGNVRQLSSHREAFSQSMQVLRLVQSVSTNAVFSVHGMACYGVLSRLWFTASVQSEICQFRVTVQ